MRLSGVVIGISHPSVKRGCASEDVVRGVGRFEFDLDAFISRMVATHKMPSHSLFYFKRPLNIDRIFELFY